MKKALLFFAAFLLLAGCTGGRQQWYNPGQTQVDFDRDAQECEIIARELARQATLTGKREDPQTYVRTYNNCLFAKGWSLIPLGQDSSETGSAPPPPSLAAYRNGTIEAFGRSFSVPAGFELQSNVQGHGPTLMQNLLFQRGSLFITYLIQKSLDRKFEPTDYPVQEPFFLYEQGKNEKEPDRLRWAIFAGSLQGEWVAGMGGYLLLGDRERMTIVVTQPLPGGAERAAPGLQLNPGQFQAMEQIRAEWLPWLERQL